MLCTLEKWAPFWGAFGMYLSVLPMNYEYYEKELLNDYIECDLKNVTHVVDGKDILIKTARVNNSLKRRTRSEKCINQLLTH